MEGSHSTRTPVGRERGLVSGGWWARGGVEGRGGEEVPLTALGMLA